MVFGDAVSKLETFVWILRAIFQCPELGLCSTYKHHTRSNDQSRHDLSCDGVSFSIG